MTDLTQLQRQLAETYEKLELVSAIIKESEAVFKLEMLPIYAQQLEAKTMAETLRGDISKMILEQFKEDGTRPNAPLAIQVRATPKIHSTAELFSWAIKNEHFAFITLDEKYIKDWLKHNHRIVSETGEVLASMVDEPVLVAGERTLLSWLQEKRFEEQFNAETTSTDETEIR